MAGRRKRTKAPADRQGALARNQYADFREAVDRLDVTVMGLLVLGVAMFLSFWLGTDNFAWGAASVLLAAVVYLAKRWVNWREKRHILVALILYLSVFVLEALGWGFPAPLAPGLGGSSGETGGSFLFSFLNTASPYIYGAIKLALVFPFALLFQERRRVDALPDRYRREWEN